MGDPSSYGMKDAAGVYVWLQHYSLDQTPVIHEIAGLELGRCTGCNRRDPHPSYFKVECSFGEGVEPWTDELCIHGLFPYLLVAEMTLGFSGTVIQMKSWKEPEAAA